MAKIGVCICINGFKRFYGGVWTQASAQEFARKENERLAGCGIKARVEVVAM